MGAHAGRATLSRFGLKMLAVFAVCAVLPVVGFAGFAYLRTVEQLEADAADSLRREAKAAAMSIVERLYLAAAELDLAILQAEGERDGAGHAFSRLDVTGLDALDVPLTPAASAHLDEGRKLLLDRAGPTGPELVLVASFDADKVLVGTLEPDFLYQPHRIDHGERYWITSAEGAFLFAADADGGSRDLVAPRAGVEPRETFTLDTPEGREIAVVWPLFLDIPFDSTGLRIGLARPRGIVLRPLEEFRVGFVAAVLLALLGSAALALRQVRDRVRPLQELVDATRRIERHDYTIRVSTRSGDEFDDLGRAFNTMVEEIGLDIAHLERLASVGADILSDPEPEEVALALARAAAEVSGARVSVVFGTTVEPDSRIRIAPLAAVSSTGEAQAIDGFDPIRLPAIGATEPLLFRRDELPEEHEARWAWFECVGRAPLEAAVVHPLISGDGRPRGFMVLGSGDAKAAVLASPRVKSTLRILTDQGSASLRIADLISSLRALFEGVIQLTVEAIDEKSPYTGDHCRRVPILTELIADAVCNSQTGRYKDVRLTQEQRYELRIAALLHDCGKVTTPVHVMDKATKLEAIGDRMDLVRLRAEVLRRDLEIEHLRERLAAVEPDAAAGDHRLAEIHARLDEDLEFLDTCNRGGEFMAPELKERVDAILAQHRWRDERGSHWTLLSEEEAENLKITKGTLNEEERQIIEGHVVTTINLLEKLPFPPELRGVPFIAGAHHEHIDGSGYPNQLGGDQLPIQARILGLADVFEALTAKDRPYKPGRTLDETLRILGFMVKDGHIDGDLLEIFLGSRAHLRYAAEYLDWEQIDPAHREAIEELSAPWAEI